MAEVVFLGPQRRQPTVNQTLESLSLQGPVCAVTAGWQEREGEIGELQEHLDRKVVDLMLYCRAERLFARRPSLRQAHRKRQMHLREQQRAYRIRLYHALETMRRLERLPKNSTARASEIRAALMALRQLDRHHLHRIQQIHSRFPEASLAEESELKELAAVVERCCSVLIAGGHIAVLLNRLRLFKFAELLRKKTVIAWSSGAMALCDRILLFHDCPPQGAGDAEIFEKGLGLISGVVALPHARQRLMLDDRERVSRLARRLAPAHCLTLDPGSLLHFISGRLADCQNSFRLMPRGKLIQPATEEPHHAQALA